MGARPRLCLRRRSSPWLVSVVQRPAGPLRPRRVFRRAVDERISRHRGLKYRGKYGTESLDLVPFSFSSRSIETPHHKVLLTPRSEVIEEELCHPLHQNAASRCIADAVSTTRERQYFHVFPRLDQIVDDGKRVGVM